MKFLNIFIIYLLFIGGISCCNDKISDQPPLPTNLILLSKKEKTHCYISTLKDQNKHLYILKQKKVSARQMKDTTQMWKRLASAAIPEAFGSYVAYQLKIPFQYVWIIPPDMKYPGKHYQNMPATLHTVVPGKPIRELYKYGILRNLYTSQHFDGVTRKLIKTMTAHRTLSLIIALDTFIGNWDRHRQNIFYDKKTKDFYGIDTDKALGFNLIKKTYQNFLMYQHQYRMYRHRLFSSAELNALRIYKNTLDQITDNFSLKHLIKIYNEYVQLCLMDSIKKENVSFIETYKSSIIQSYKDCYKLIGLLNLITKSTNTLKVQ